VGGDEVTMAVFHELSWAEDPSQQTGLTANFLQTAPEIHVSLVSPRMIEYDLEIFTKLSTTSGH
jgi:hypothetical protein